MSKRILVVDDEESIVEIVRTSLESEGYDIETATNGREALEKASSNPPDMIVLDVLMPEIDGFTALRRLKENEATAAIPVIMLTARDEEADVLSGWLRGADLYMTKPFNPWELIENVNLIFREEEGTDDFPFPDDE